MYFAISSLLFGGGSALAHEPDTKSNKDGDRNKKAEVKDNKKSKLPSKSELTEDVSLKDVRIYLKFVPG